MARKPYTPERAYRVSVIPLSIFMAVGGIVFFVVALVADGTRTFMPPLGPGAARIAFGAVGLYLVFVGVGMLRRIRLAWYGLFAYLVLGTPWACWAFATAPGVEAPVSVGISIFGVLLNVTLGVGLYFATKPAFLSAGGPAPRTEGSRSEASSPSTSGPST